jgi:hypothetical protein
VLAVWPVVTMMLFILLPAHRALIWSVLGAYLVLPVSTAFEIPGVPPLDKTTISNLSIILCCILFVREKWLGALKDPVVVVLATTFIVSPVFTAYFNSEPLVYADRFIPAMTLYDALAQAAIHAFTLIPFVVAYGLINSDQRRWQVIAILVTAALAYSVLILIEVRISPQFHRLIYGFFPHSFGQQMRGGGFRPVVFLGHGLLVAVFCAMAITAAIAQWRVVRKRQRSRAGLIAIYFGVVLLLCKSVGAIILAAVFAPIVAFLRVRRVAAISAAACFAILLYPAMRSVDIIPINSISDLAASFSTDRADSLRFRLINEDLLLDKVAQKPLVGWGSWGRNRIYSPTDGRDLSVTDGGWIIALGTWGWMGYLAMFGLLGYGCIRLLASRRQVHLSTAALGLILATNLLDSLPNSSINALTWLAAGILAGATRKHALKQDRKVRPSPNDGSVNQPRTTAFPPTP